MPELHVRLTWRDGGDTRCCSPSLVIKDFVVPGTTDPVADSPTCSREAYGIASGRS